MVDVFEVAMVYVVDVVDVDILAGKERCKRSQRMSCEETET